MNISNMKITESFSKDVEHLCTLPRLGVSKLVSLSLGHSPNENKRSIIEPDKLKHTDEYKRRLELVNCYLREGTLPYTLSSNSFDTDPLIIPMDFLNLLDDLEKPYPQMFRQFVEKYMGKAKNWKKEAGILEEKYRRTEEENLKLKKEILEGSKHSYTAPEIINETLQSAIQRAIENPHFKLNKDSFAAVIQEIALEKGLMRNKTYPAIGTFVKILGKDGKWSINIEPQIKEGKKQRKEATKKGGAA